MYAARDDNSIRRGFLFPGRPSLLQQIINGTNVDLDIASRLTTYWPHFHTICDDQTILFDTLHHTEIQRDKTLYETLRGDR